MGLARGGKAARRACERGAMNIGIDERQSHGTANHSRAGNQHDEIPKIHDYYCGGLAAIRHDLDWAWRSKAKSILLR